MKMKSKVRLAKMRLFTRVSPSRLLDLSIVHALPEWPVHSLPGPQEKTRADTSYIGAGDGTHPTISFRYF